MTDETKEEAAARAAWGAFEEKFTTDVVKKLTRNFTREREPVEAAIRVAERAKCVAFLRAQAEDARAQVGDYVADMIATAADEMERAP